MVISDRKSNIDHRDATVVATTPNQNSFGKTKARLVGSTIAGVSELLIFYPIDTVAKRLMSTETRIVVTESVSLTVSNFNRAIFRDTNSLSSFSKVTGLFPGIGFGAVYKILQRVYKFGGQPVVLERMTTHFGEDFDRKFGHKLGHTILSATSGSLIGIGEVALLPLDALKVKAQTVPEQLRGRGVFNIFAKEGLNLYRGAGWTIARNAPGSFALFGGNAAAKILMDVEENKRASWSQDAIASCAGATASITISAPLDVVKTRIQNRPFDMPESGSSIIKNMIRNEGIGGFFKGLTPKLLAVGPKLVFSFTIAQHTISYFMVALK